MSSPAHTSEAITRVVELTPPGRAAVAVVLVAGPDAVRAVGDCFVPVSKRSLAEVPLGRIVFGRWGAGGEELIVCRRAEDKVEVHCHGGAAAVRAVLSRLIEVGCVQTKWQDWLRQSAREPISVAAQTALANALTARTAAILLDQWNGALKATLLAAIAAIETADWLRATELVDELLSRRDFGLHLTTPWRVVLAGAPNVGKSSLINALAGYERAIVSPTPGTTRDVVTVTTAIDGWPVQLADTAGLRDTRDELETAGVELARTSLANADLAILVQDATASVERLPYLISDTSRTIRVRNKIDLVIMSEQSPFTRGEIATSALTGVGIQELAEAIGKSLVPAPPAPNSPVPFTGEHFKALTVARDAVEVHDAVSAAAALQSLLSKY